MANVNDTSQEETGNTDRKNPLPESSETSAVNISSGTSIGPGTSDQGFEPGEEDRDDEFRKDEFQETVLDKENMHHGTRPSHGLVEEGPGPDS